MSNQRLPSGGPWLDSAYRYVGLACSVFYFYKTFLVNTASGEICNTEHSHSGKPRSHTSRPTFPDGHSGMDSGKLLEQGRA